MFVGQSFIVNQFDHVEADYFGYFVHHEVNGKNLYWLAHSLLTDCPVVGECPVGATPEKFVWGGQNAF